jgi:uncharacterized protein (TIGR03000 family)
MYSMVLMAALTVTPDAAAFGRGGFGGCSGCTGTVVSVGCTGCTGTTSCFGSCYGSSCTGSCYGSSCTGSCYGSSCTGSCYGGGRLFARPLFPRLRSLFGGGCTGSCYGSSCTGSCYGSSCTGSCYGSGCTGSCFGSGCYSSGSCFGSCTGYAPTTFGSGSCFGTSGPVYYGADFNAPMVAPVVTGSSIIDGLGSVPTVTIDHSAARATPAASPARLTVELPATAKLFVDGREVKGDGEARNFHTPELPAGKSFFYDLKAEVEVNGRTVTEEMRVIVKAGDASTKAFEKLIAAVKTDKTDVATK